MNKDITPRNDKGQLHGYWEWYNGSDNPWYKGSWYNGEYIGYWEHYNIIEPYDCLIKVYYII